MEKDDLEELKGKLADARIECELSSVDEWTYVKVQFRSRGEQDPLIALTILKDGTITGVDGDLEDFGDLRDPATAPRLFQEFEAGALDSFRHLDELDPDVRAFLLGPHLPRWRDELLSSISETDEETGGSLEAQAAERVGQ